MLINQSLEAFLDETASSSPAPGGGSVSALAGSLSAALASMVCQLTIGKKKYAGVEERMKEIFLGSEEIRRTMQSLIDADTKAFQGVMKAFSMAKDTDEQKSQRSSAIQEATKEATKVPMDLVRSCSRLMSLVEDVAEHGNTNSLSDAGVSALLLGAAVRGAAFNVYINLAGLKDETFVRDIRKECEEAEADVSKRCETVAAKVKSALAG